MLMSGIYTHKTHSPVYPQFHTCRLHVFSLCSFLVSLRGFTYSVCVMSHCLPQGDELLAGEDGAGAEVRVSLPRSAPLGLLHLLLDTGAVSPHDDL